MWESESEEKKWGKKAAAKKALRLVLKNNAVSLLLLAPGAVNCARA